jgi:hypothetical protein
MRLLKEFGQSSTPFRLVASATPGDTELEALGGRDREMFLDRKKETRERIEKTLEECQVSPPKIFHDIPEIVWLKWREEVTVFSGEVTEYEKLAASLIAEDSAAATPRRTAQPARNV